MCYLKHLPVLDSLEAAELKNQESSSSLGASSTQVALLPIKKNQLFKKKQDPLFYLASSGPGVLPMLLDQLKFNSYLVSFINQKINSVFPLGQDTQSVNKQAEIKPANLLLKKLFGAFDQQFGLKNFSYKLSLQQKPPEKIYKCQKIKFSVKLVINSSGNPIQVINNNPLDICIGAFDFQGNWILQNLKGEPIITGVTCTDLYRGKAEFTKIYVQEISSNLAQKKINLVIYAKPGQKRNLIEDRISKEVQWFSIKPLIINNVTILSKKRKNLLKSFDE